MLDDYFICSSSSSYLHYALLHHSSFMMTSHVTRLRHSSSKNPPMAFHLIQTKKKKKKAQPLQRITKPIASLTPFPMSLPPCLLCSSPPDTFSFHENVRQAATSGSLHWLFPLRGMHPYRAWLTSSLLSSL